MLGDNRAHRQDSRNWTRDGLAVCHRRRRGHPIRGPMHVVGAHLAEGA